jgi:hypothetical protein
MNKLQNLFENIRQRFSIKRVIDFEGYDLSITIQPLTSIEELKVIEACKDVEGVLYLESLKKSSLAFAIRRVNDLVFESTDVEYEDNEGKLVVESKYLFLLRQIESWPAALRDTIFEAFNNMTVELEYTLARKTKYERFQVQPSPEEKISEENTAPKGFVKVEEPQDQTGG